MSSSAELPTTKIDVFLFIRYFKKLSWDAFIPTLLVFFVKQEKWISFVNFFGLSDRVFFTVATFVLHELLYYGINLMTLSWDHFKLFQSFKLPRIKAQEPSNELIKKSVLESIPGHWIIQPLLLYYLYDAFVYFGTTVRGNIPHFTVVFTHVFIASITNDFLFYFMHRLFHHPSIYEMIHKKHHEFKGTIGFAAEYSHPIESLTANLIPTFLGSLLLGTHAIVWLSWLFYRSIETYESHSGYNFGIFSFAGVAEYHDYHHTHNLGNYGVGEFCDALFRTNGHYLKHKSKSL